MKLKNFQDLLEQKLTKDEIAEIEEQAELEVRALRSLQINVQKALASYMRKQKVGFNEVVRRLNSTPAQVAKIQKGEANLTLASLAHLSALLGAEPTLIFKKRS